MSSARIEAIFHPSDFTHASEIAFAHALRIALVTRAMLHILHADREHDADWKDFPGVRETLARWRLIPPGSPKSAVVDLGIGVEKIIQPHNDPVDACLDFLERHQVDLIVLAVRQLEGRMRWVETRVGERVWKKAQLMTLLLPHDVAGFISREDGSLSLRNILIPVAVQPRAEAAIAAVERLIAGLGLASGSVTMVHVRQNGEAPTVRFPTDSEWDWEYVVTDGKPHEAILTAARDRKADLIAMTTSGHQGFLDALRGSTSERLLSKSRCPILCVPA